jgi:hypothetical protein
MFLTKSRIRIHPINEPAVATESANVQAKEVETEFSVSFSEFDVFSIAKNVLHAIQKVSPNWLDRQNIDPVQVSYNGRHFSCCYITWNQIVSPYFLWVL